jgi:phosphodiesterase/alkaline phosphatase D-like protein
MTRLLVGPVVGKVTDADARILVETDKDAQLRVELTKDDEVVASVVHDVQARTPTGVAVTGLQPETHYSYRVVGVDGARHGQLRTFPTVPERMNIAAVSCNFTVKCGETKLWSHLRDRYVRTNEIDLVVHLGDQIYGDTAFTWALNELDGSTARPKAVERRILERYRDLYRQTWNHDATAEVLAETSNLMIWDDHEIRDDWGSRCEDKDPDSVDYYIGTLARRVYREYQRQLWDPAALVAPSEALEYHAHAWGRMGLLFVDQRSGRSFHSDPARPYLGTPQWQWITDSLFRGQLSQCAVLVVATSVPLAYLGMRATATGSRIIDDLQDHWAYPAHQKEQVEFLRTLRQWKEARPDRCLLLLGGDVHVGGHTDVTHDGTPFCTQLITGTITNKPPAWFGYALLRGILETQERLGDRYRFEHHDFTNDRAFGIALLRSTAGMAPHVSASLVTA